MMKRASLILAGALCIALPIRAADDAGRAEEGLFENVAAVLAERFYDEDFRQNELPKVIERYRKRAAEAADFEAECDVVQAFLSNIPATHTALIRSDVFDGMHKELSGVSVPTFGFELIEYDGKQYAFNVLEKGPAASAGLRRGDRIVLIDGVIVEDSPRLGCRTDDAFLPDPPVRSVKGAEGDVLKLKIELAPGKYTDLEVRCAPYSSWEATKASVRVVEHGGKRIGVIHFWLIYMSGPDELLKQVLEGELASCDALVLDLRGRGGNGFMVPRMLEVLDGTTSSWTKPVVALINGHTRSAKEVIAYEFRKLALGSLVGERTAGAVIPVSTADVGFGMSLMFPSFTLGEHTDLLEFKGVSPDVVVSEVGPYSAGADPILEAGVQEAARLAGEPPEALKARRAAAAKTHPKKQIGADAAGASPGLKSRIPSRTLPEEPDPPGYDAKAMEVWAKMVEATGGKTAMRRHSYRTIRGKRVMGGMIHGTFEELAAAPNKRIDRMVLPGMGKMERGYDGTIAWEVSPQEGTKIMDEERRADYLARADFYGALTPKKHHRSIVYVGQTKVDDKVCHELRMTSPSGEVETHFLDAATFLPVAWIGTVHSNMGPLEMRQIVDAFDTFDGEVMPTAFTADVGGMQEMVTTVREVSFDKLPDGTFDPPEELSKD
ncbi:MAG: S41 family peptidase [Phycisphaerae bacterium]|jgi:carboxyl-terminal processing protease